MPILGADGQPLTIEKGKITVTPPSNGIRVISGAQGGVDHLITRYKRRDLMMIYYEMYAKHPWIRAGIDKIAKTAVNAGYAFAPTEIGGKVASRKQKTLNALFRRSRSKQLFRAIYRDLFIFGEAYVWVERRRGDKQPIRLQRLNPIYVTPTTNASDITGYDYGPIEPDKNKQHYGTDEVLAFLFDDPDSDISGLSPLYSLIQTVSEDLFAAQYNLSFFENSAQTGVIFSMKGLTQDEIDRNRTWLETNYVGAQRAHRPIILEGDVDIKKSVVPPAEMEFVEGRKLLRQEILSVLDVPASKLGISEDANRSNSKEEDNTFREETVAPSQDVVEEEINDNLILTMFGWDDILFQHNEVGQRSQMAQFQMYGALIDKGLMTRNEARSKMGLPSLGKNGDLITVQASVGLIPLDKVEEVADAMVQQQSAMQGQQPDQPKDPEQQARNEAKNPDRNAGK